MNEKNGGFLFISHSHHDMDKVRQLRNRLEDEGFDPLCFYLKCLDEHPEELNDLIKREIDARQWFVYAVSPNSEKSTPVQCERRWRKRPESKNRQEWKWDLESDIPIDEISKTLIKGLRVNIIYAHRDIGFVNKLKDKLKEKDLQVTTDFDMNPGKDWNEQLMGMAKAASEFGTNIVVLSENSIHSKPVIDEVKFASECKSMIIPVYIDDVELDGYLLLRLHGIQGIMPENPIKDETDLDSFVEKVVDEIRLSLDRYFK